jgi:hypothetical protein
VKESLLGDIAAMGEQPHTFSTHPKKDFTRSRKIGFESVVRLIISMEGGTVRHEMLKWPSYDKSAPTASAFCQQRDKLLPDAFRTLLLMFNPHFPATLYKGKYRVLACDGSEFNIARNPGDPSTFYPPNGKSTAGFNMVHLVAMYDLLGKMYLDATVQPGRKKNEYRAICGLIDKDPPADGIPILTADRGFASYNVYAHAHENGWFFLVRCTDVKVQRLLGGSPSDMIGGFDRFVHRILTRTHSLRKWGHPEASGDYRVVSQDVPFDYIGTEPGDEYAMDLRVVRFELGNGAYENIVTNLPQDEFAVEELKRLYNMRWGIETSFRDLKHSIGAASFHSRKAKHIEQELWARLVLYNFCSIIMASVEIVPKDTMYGYQANFTMAIKICHYFLRLPEGRPPPDVGALIAMSVLPVRPGRQYPRKKRFQKPVAFGYRHS